MYDGEYFDTQDFELTILSVNDAPIVVNTIEDLEVLEGNDEIVINLTDIFYDLENGNELSYTAYESISALEVYISEDELYTYDTVFHITLEINALKYQMISLSLIQD